jgi:Ni,Fe-hydrogenase maturation factor
MTIYLFGNQDHAQDNIAFMVADKLLKQFPKLKFVTVKPNQDLPFENETQVIILDAVEGIEKITLITQKNIDKIQLPPRFSAHDFDLGFQLKYLKKIGKIKGFTIIGLPMSGNVDWIKLEKVIKNINASQTP